MHQLECHSETANAAFRSSVPGLLSEAAVVRTAEGTERIIGRRGTVNFPGLSGLSPYKLVAQRAYCVQLH
jgi:hypothetical protein